MNEAIKFLTGDLTLALALGECVYVSNRRGVSSLLEFLENGTNLRGFHSADKVVGKGAAFLYVLLGVSSVHGTVMSACAKDVLKDNNITVTYDILVDRIVNRDKTGFCPIEEAVLAITEPQQALIAMKEKLTKLRS